MYESRPAAPTLRGVVRGYTAYREDAPLRRREVPSGRVVVIVGLGTPLRVDAQGTFTSFVSGLDHHPALTAHDGGQRGIQVDLTPTGAFRLFGVPLRHLSGTVVELPDVLGPQAEELRERVAEAPGWDDRFRLLDELLTGMAADGPRPRAEIDWAWQRLERSGGTVPIRSLVEQVGWSHRHLATLFREQIGLTPKAAGRVLRFGRAVALLNGSSQPSLADIAARCGYSDQPHLNREFRALAGCTPTEYIAGNLGALAVVAAGESEEAAGGGARPRRGARRGGR